jgi:ATP-binding cassette subfamily B protein
MKSLAYLNKYLWKYRGRMMAGFIFILLTNIFNVYAPQIIGEGIDFVATIIREQKHIQKNDVVIKTPESLHWISALTGWGDEITLNTQNWQSYSLQIGLLLALGYIVVYLIKGVFLFYQRQSLIVMSRHIEYDLKNEIYQQYQNLDVSFYRQNRTGDLMNRISEDVNRVRMYLGPAVMYTINLVILIVLCAGVMWNIDATLTLYTLAPMPLMMVGIFYVSTIINKRTEKVQRQQSKLTTIVQETFSGIRVIKSFRKEKKLSNDFQIESDQYKGLQMKLVKSDALFMPVISILVGLSTILTIYIGASQVEKGAITVGTIVQFVFYVNQLTWPFASVGWVTSLVRKAEASQTRINEFLQAKPIIKNNPTASTPIHGNIKWENVSYTYPDTGIKALKNVSFELKQGQSMGIIGKTGSGKSTLFQLMTKNFDPTQGEIAFENTPLPQVDLIQIRKSISWVPQEVFLFSDTIKSNILFGKDDASQEDLIAAADDAGVLQDILQFPQQWETVLGERGINISGGQKQRISIARAFITSPQILLLDDCLSAVDTATEEKILRGIKRRMQNRTSVIISHRVSSIQHCDLILVLDNGQVMESGSHEELIAKKGLYHHFYQMQHEQQSEI